MQMISLRSWLQARLIENKSLLRDPGKARVLFHNGDYKLRMPSSADLFSVWSYLKAYYTSKENHILLGKVGGWRLEVMVLFVG